MSQFAVQESSLIIDGHAFKDYLIGAYIEITKVNPATTQIRSADSVVGFNRADAGVADVTVRLLRYSDDDVFLNNKLLQDFSFMNGSFVRNVQTGSVAATEVYKLDAGSIYGQPAAVYDNADGNEGMEYVIRFNNAIRSL